MRALRRIVNHPSNMLRRAPRRSQAAADESLATLGDSSTVCDPRAGLGCADLPLVCLSLDDDFIVINKPVYVRMDGDFDVTVQKLIRHWHPDLVNKDLKWVHQLDFATSGVLCVALHRDAAARACTAFRERRAEKAYLAIVEGIVDSTRVTSRIEEAILGWGEETNSKDGGRPAKGKTGKSQKQAVQYYPAHFFFKRQKDKLLRALEKGESVSETERMIANASWADIKHDAIAAKPFRDASQDDHARSTAAADEAAFTAAQGAPDRGVFRGPGDGPEVFRIDACVSEVPGDFRMKVDNKPGEGGRLCRTKVEVLETGKYMGQPVTKLLLRPHTGRRHQLRLHTLHIGHPILGDATYARDKGEVPRMCLHAHSLRLHMAPPLISASQYGAETNSNAGKGLPERRKIDAAGIFDCLLKATARDPFPFVDGELQL